MIIILAILRMTFIKKAVITLITLGRHNFIGLRNFSYKFCKLSASNFLVSESNWNKRSFEGKNLMTEKRLKTFKRKVMKFEARKSCLIGSFFSLKHIEAKCSLYDFAKL